MDGATVPHADGLDEAALTPVVRRVLDRHDAEVTSWQSHTVHGGAGGAGIYRVTGSARIGGKAHSWSVIHKVIRASDDAVDPTALRYWAREPLAYSSGALAHLPGGLATPRCYGITEVPNREYALWLEDVGDTTPSWTLAQFGAVARQLGRFNAAYLMGTSAPNWPWLNRAFLRSWIVSTHVSQNITAVRDFPDLPRVRRWYPDGMRDQVLELWDDRETLLAPLERSPQTLCHMDAFRRNLLVRRLPNGSGQFVLIDWAFIGMGALGEELAALVSATVAFFGADTSELDELDRIVFEGYLAGLADAGWRGDTRTVRYAYAVASAVRFKFPFVIDLLDESSYPWVEQVVGRRMPEIVTTFVNLRRFLFCLADEARELLHVGL